jgi:hypothetical protein
MTSGGLPSRRWGKVRAKAAMEAGNPSDEELWEACRILPSDWEPHGQRRWHGRREARPDCDTCRWFVGLLRTSPDWGVCASLESERGWLLTHREQGCWQHEPGNERSCRAARPARCDFMRAFEAFLREQAADFIKAEVHRANEPSPSEEPPVTTPEDIRETPLFFVVRRLLRHADEDFRRLAFTRMVASARKDSGRYWEFACCFWSRALGVDISEIDLPINSAELEQKFWNRVEATIAEALRGRRSKATKNRRRDG